MLDMEGRLKGIVEDTRASQATLVREREDEQTTRYARRLNLRVVGLEELEEEDTKAIVLTFFNTATITGGADLWASSDVVALAETWEWQERAQLDIPDFVRIGTSQGRFYVRFLIFAYFAPCGSPVYAGDTGDPFSELTRITVHLRESGPVWVLGDFNCRIGNTQGAILPEVGERPWEASEDLEVWHRISEDTGRNKWAENFVQYATVGGLTILNGSKQFPGTGVPTCYTPNGKSLIDYLLATQEARDKVSAFSIDALTPDSDHCPLYCVLKGFCFSRNSKRKVKTLLLLDRGHGRVFADRVS
ncbi:hypothetical protein R1sor_014114 [Riccia sorocarpa]|uniref:Endonuclease/exonuclease/phosphatase domain-containing protein n=1 Tax=Riccia sorocarpa TaxID=122646 RepID=A0ABD3HBN1_9MARC